MFVLESILFNEREISVLVPRLFFREIVWIKTTKKRLCATKKKEKINDSSIYIPLDTHARARTIAHQAAETHAAREKEREILFAEFWAQKRGESRDR